MCLFRLSLCASKYYHDDSIGGCCYRAVSYHNALVSDNVCECRSHTYSPAVVGLVFLRGIHCFVPVYTRHAKNEGSFVLSVVVSCHHFITIVTDPIIRQPGFDLPRHTWSLLNRFRTGQGPCRANFRISPWEGAILGWRRGHSIVKYRDNGAWALSRRQVQWRWR